jgi:hypothetical protein
MYEVPVLRNIRSDRGKRRDVFDRHKTVQSQLKLHVVVDVAQIPCALSAFVFTFILSHKTYSMF